MPRPANGYKNSIGQPVPGTSDITKRFMDKSRLLLWAFSRGKQGLPQLYDDNVLNIGTCVHMMAEMDLKDQCSDDIEYYLKTTLPDRESRQKAQSAFRAYRQWRDEFHVRAYEQEISLVSEKLQYGGTLDTIAVVRNGLGLVDFKTSTSGEVYEDMVIQLAAYGILWNETHPDDPIDQGYHLIVLPKDGSPPRHREYSEDALHPYRQLFWCYRKAYDLTKLCADTKNLAGEFIHPSRKPSIPPRSKAQIISDIMHATKGRQIHARMVQ